MSLMEDRLQGLRDRIWKSLTMLDLKNLNICSASGLSVENQPGDVIKEEIAESMSAGISFVVRDWREARSLEEAHKADPRYHRPTRVLPTEHVVAGLDIDSTAYITNFITFCCRA